MWPLPDTLDMSDSDADRRDSMQYLSVAVEGNSSLVSALETWSFFFFFLSFGSGLVFLSLFGCTWKKKTDRWQKSVVNSRQILIENREEGTVYRSQSFTLENSHVLERHFLSHIG